MPLDCESPNIRPLDPKDQWKPIDNIRSLLFIVVREVLNHDALRVALDELIRHHLPILGARIKRNRKNRSLEYHLPRTISEDYALFSWSTRAVHAGLETSDLLPRVTDKSVTTVSSIPTLEAHWTPCDWPVERKFDKPDTRLLLVHLTRYTNSTVVAMNLPHAVADQMGFGSLIRAWLLVYRGEQPPPFLDLSQGQLDGPKNVSKKEMRTKGKYRLVSRKEKLEINLGLMLHLMPPSKEERRTLFFPTALIERLRDKHQESLKANYGVASPLLTNGDILAGMLVKV
ncbi:hypothetical protein PCL_12221 [Purpureocillium lilacinum]|uniref:BCL5p n=1 Tax=Purpureocillium lilacinum TaxID=33203 RepID=A0A2U3E8L6_PURLI|nr:hypothetical protein PCL_12221 [Purpureocillium lilacinum]